jgi:hypothetical protein
MVAAFKGDPLKSNIGFRDFVAENRSAVDVLVSVDDHGNWHEMEGDHILRPGATLEATFRGDLGRWFDWSWTAKNLVTGEVVSGHSGEWPHVIFFDAPANHDEKVRAICWGQNSVDPT